MKDIIQRVLEKMKGGSYVGTGNGKMSLGGHLDAVFLDGWHDHPARKWREMPEQIRKELLSDHRLGHIFRKLFGVP